MILKIGLILGMIIPYIIYSWLSFSQSSKGNLFFILTIVLVSLGNLIWSYGATKVSSTESFYLRMIFESGAILAFSLVPVVWFNLKLDLVSWLGVALIISGFLIFNYKIFG